MSANFHSSIRNAIPVITYIKDSVINDSLTNALDTGIISYWCSEARLVGLDGKVSGFSTGDFHDKFMDSLRDGTKIRFYVDDDGGESARDMTLQSLKDGLEKLSRFHPDVLARMVNEQSDAGDDDLLIQYALFCEAVYG